MLIFDQESKKISSYSSCDNFRDRYLPKVTVEECFKNDDVSYFAQLVDSGAVLPFFSTEEGQIKAKHTLKARIINEAIEDGEFILRLDRDARKSVGEALKAVEQVNERVNQTLMPKIEEIFN